MQTKYDPFTTVGFDRIFNRIEQMHSATAKTVTYPPYNITKESDTTFMVEMAIAGFTDDDIDIHVKESVLTIVGSVSDTDEKEYLHKGIAARAFERTFTLAETVVVKDAALSNGMLRILLEDVIPEDKKAQKIVINKSFKGVDTKELLTE
jgi:molecular chaperone IbpA